MTEEEILAELRTMRTLLALDKEEELSEILSGLDEVHEAIIGELDEEWGSLSTSELADGCDVGTSTLNRRIDDLVEANLIEQRGSGPGTEYRITGLLRAAKLVTSN